MLYAVCTTYGPSTAFILPVLMRRHRKELRALTLFVVLFAMALGGGAISMQPGGPIAAARQVTPRIRVPEPGWFPVYYRGGEQLDHTYVWNDFASAVAGARRADVLILGTSRVQFALPVHDLRAFEKRTGQRAFSLALPGESFVVALEIIEKFDLRPPIAVAEVDGFFSEGPYVTRVVDEGWWGGVTTVWEEDLAAATWPVASPVLPSFIIRRPARYLLRSSAYGTWLPVLWPHRHTAPTVASAGSPAERMIERARGVRDALARRGTQLVLTCVPTGLGGCSPAYAHALADAIDVPVVTPPIEGLWTSDRIHLCPLSAKRFARALLRGVGKLEMFRGRPRRRSVAAGGVVAMADVPEDVQRWTRGAFTR
jgi:hypothetical protein